MNVAIAPKWKQLKKSNEYEGNGCFFCGAAGHVKKHYTNHHARCYEKGILLNLVCFEINLTFSLGHI